MSFNFSYASPVPICGNSKRRQYIRLISRYVVENFSKHYAYIHLRTLTIL
jgi:hypothetical protein